MSEPLRSSSTQASGLGDPAVAALARLAFGPSLPAATLVAEAGQEPGSPRLSLFPADALDLDLDDPEQCRFGDYTLIAKLGQGGMGVVYRAHQFSLDREVAVKLLAAGPWASPGFIERFRQEAQSAARMQHPNIVTIHEIGEQDGLPFFSMRLVRGPSLAERIRGEGALAPRQAAALMRQVAEAVDYAHRLGVLHLDLKPGNVLLDESGEPMVADFGLARRLEETLAADSGGEISGTPSYMAPEQAAGDGRLGMATDVYALGATLYETLTARPPFRGATARETLEQVVRSSAPVPRSFDTRIPLDLQAICMRCLRKDPGERYPSARALAEDLGRYLEGREVRARPLGQWQRGLRMVRREPRLSALVALFVVSLLGGLFATTVQWNRADANAADARTHLWASRAQAAEQALADGDGFRGLQAMVDNLAEMEAAGRGGQAAIERERIGILLANAPQLLHRLQLEPGASVSSMAISPDGSRFALAYHLTDGRRMFRQYRAADAGLEWESSNPGNLQLTPFPGIPHGYMRYSSDGRHILLGLMPQPVFAAPCQHDSLLLRSSDGALVVPPEAGQRLLDTIYSDDASLALVRYLSDRSRRFPETVRLYATEGWRPLGPERPHAATQWLFAPDNRGLLATTDMLRLDFLDPLTLEPRWSLQLDPGQEVMAWAFTPDARLLALGGNDGSVHLVDVASGARQSLPSAPTVAVRWVAFDARGASLAAQSEDGQVAFWDVASRRPRLTPVQFGTGLRNLPSFRLSEDLLLLPVGNDLRGWMLPPVAPFDSHALAAPARLTSSRDLWSHAFDYHAESRLTVLGGRDGRVGIWRWSKSPLLPVKAAPLPSTTLHVDAQGVVAVAGHSVQIVDRDGRRLTDWIAEYAEPVRFAEFSSGGRWLVVLAGRSLSVHDPVSGAQHGETWLLPATPLRAELAGAAQLLVLGFHHYEGDQFTEELWALDLDGASWRRQRPRAAGPLTRFALDPQGRFVVASGSMENAHSVHDALLPLTEDAPDCRFPAGQHRLLGGFAAIAEDGRLLWTLTLAAQRKVSIHAWDLGSCRLLHELSLGSIGGVPVMRTVGERLVLQGLSLEHVDIFDARGGHRRFPTVPATQLMQTMAVSRDGRLLAQALRSAVHVFDLESGERLSASLAAPLAGNDGIALIEFSADGEQLLARTAQGHWLSWSLGHPLQEVGELKVLGNTLLAGGEVEEMAAPLPDPVAVAATVAPVAPFEPKRILVGPAEGAGVAPQWMPLDLRPIVNAPFDGSWPRRLMMSGDALTLGQGIHRLLGVDLRIDGGVQLSGGGAAALLHPEQPASEWIPFAPVQARRLHLLMLHHIPMRVGDPPRVAARVWLRRVDGVEFALEIQSQRNVVTHFMADALQGSLRIGWSGTFPAAIRSGGASSADTSSGAFLVSLDLPAGTPAVQALRLAIGDGPMEAPLFYAATLERASPGDAGDR